MMHLKNLLTKPLQAPTSLVVAILIVALLGFADATYLTIEHYSGVIPPCAVGGCEQVLTSDYSTIGGIPVALGGAIYYFLILLGTFVYLIEGKKEVVLRSTLLFTVVGMVSTLYFFAIQAFVLKAFCLYCLGSAATSTILFVLAIVVFSKYSRNSAHMSSSEPRTV